MSGPIDLAFSWLWSRLFAFSPDVAKRGNILEARTCRRAHIFSFGFASRIVTVDADHKLVRICERTFWFVRRARYVPFSAIREIGYGYRDVAAFAEWSEHQADDLFSVSLIVQPREEVLLFRFYGYGDFVNNGVWPDWMYWGDQFEAELTRNDKEGEARLLAEVVSGLVGAPIGSVLD